MPLEHILILLIVQTFALGLVLFGWGCIKRANDASHSKPCDTVTKADLDKLENNITMRLSEIKKQVAAAAEKSTEAFAELGKRIEDLQKQIDDLIAGASDPDVTDEAFLNDLNTVKNNVNALADIVPNPNPTTTPAPTTTAAPPTTTAAP